MGVYMKRLAVLGSTGSIGCSATISRVLTPMEPVEPRMARGFMQTPIRHNRMSRGRRTTGDCLAQLGHPDELAYLVVAQVVQALERQVLLLDLLEDFLVNLPELAKRRH